MACQNNESVKYVMPCVKSKGAWTIPKFSDCIVNSLAEGQKVVEVMCCLSNNRFMIAPANDSKSFVNLCDKNLAQGQSIGPLNLEHSLICPMYEVEKGTSTDVTFPINRIHVAVAVAVILESSDSHVLLTKRASTMRTYPGVWVPPGGHLDKDESLLKCGLRELEEETGLKLEESDIKSNYLCLWEAVAPPILALGSPRSHSIVIYVHIQVPYTMEEMQPKISVNQDEVEAWCWYTRNTILHLQRGDDTSVLIHKPGDAPGKYETVEVNPASMFRSSYLWSQNTFYSGTHQALVHWSRRTSKL